MSATTILDNEYATLWFHPEKKIVHHQFHKFIFGEAFRNVLSTGVEVMKKNGAHKWLSDDRNNSAISQEDREWGDSVWTPQVVAAGWKYWAVVLPEKVVGQMSMKHLIEDYSNRGVKVQVFSDPAQALKWLEGVQ
jgi:hypothetical protein